jgi:hypothetical protein
MDSYDQKIYSFDYAPELAPYFNFGAEAKVGARMARPAKRIGTQVNILPLPAHKELSGGYKGDAS